MANVLDLKAKWEARRAEHARLGSIVSMATVCEDVLSDLSTLTTFEREATTTVAEAALKCGYHPETLKRQIRAGTLKNYGTARRPRVHLSECPKRAQTSAADQSEGERSAARPVVAEVAKEDALFSSAIIAMDVLTSRRQGRKRAAGTPRSA